MMKPIFLQKINNLFHFLWALGSAFFYRFPSQKMVVIGVTGTTGKSTTVEMIAAVLEKVGYKTASISSIRFKVAGESSENLMKQTMPGRGYLQKFLRKALDSGCQYAVIEVSSEGIKQHRQRFINFDVGVITNLAPEHIESHGGFENYKKTKIKFFTQITSSREKIIGGKEIKKILAINSEMSETVQFAVGDVPIIDFDSKKADDVNLKLVGEFWNLNANAALAAAQSQGVDRGLAVGVLNSIESIPGRMEEVKEGQDFRVFIDYAHTPDALESVYKTLSSKPQAPSSKLICVLGAAGGGRDKWKRPEFGKLAWQYCDEIILSNEDPYDENPEEILNQISSGFSQIRNSKFEIRNFHKILDRREAIVKAIDLTRGSDIVIITGKGCESWMMVAGGKKIPWDDRKIVREALLNKKSA
ncbi:hypothetical protein A2833_00615 [Candidatus Azambacteria bacterium RIFCSPHIGHO2_01_FULL_44_55]|nr:MAG: hypothetical protein A3C78_01550 [Candidatus Azambacteria bacterium RIFCSPHIGHO2_02_FULL_45_18]OGD40873.1 MAG: hypothetical protein A2833_00615 [Candidatus Azambacteria bacterium RIFCSPHIGHO2_01_FULL_44_55]OGD50506.1 MAG: hypothetical protein A2608_02030 [Candidatus Azambacteria bacterium RIFOXYD1_FULL_44_10]